MKNFTSTFALILVLMFVGLYIYLVEYPSYQQRKLKKVFFTAEVEEVSIADKQTNKITLLINKDGSWTVNGKNAEDPKAINTMIQTLKGKAEKTLSTLPKDSELKDYGLNDPVMIIDVKGHEVKDVSKKVTETISIGSKAPVGFGRYMLLKSKNTIVISSDIYDSFNKEVK